MYTNMEANELISVNDTTVNEAGWNVIGEEEFKKRVSNVFDRVAKSLSKTLGPYGATTIIEKYGEMHITKDGWQVLKNIRFNNMIENNILMLLLRISAQVVIKVGDGSTSSIVSADAILKELNKHEKLKTLRSKELMDILSRCANLIIERIYENSTKINKDTYDEIYKLAYVSTNGDAEISEIIKDIYIKTGNPSIEFNSSKTNKTSYEIINGYRGNITYLDRIFITNDEGTCVVDNPYILMFDHKVDMDVSLPIITAATKKAYDENRRLVVIAPFYDKYLLQYIKKNIESEFRARGTTIVVYTKATLINNMSYELFNDFAILCGAEVIREQFEPDINPDEQIVEYLGTVSQMVIGEKTTFIKGFVNRNESMYNKAIDDATSKYNDMLSENEKKGIVDIKLNEAKQRLTKLKCSMGVINVGGNSELEKNANYDLVEDAVKACESAFNFGYNVGCSLVIPQIITKMLDDEEETDVEKIYGNRMYTAVLDVIYGAFINVYETILKNKYNNNSIFEEEKIKKIKNETTENGFTKCYDLIKDEFSSEVINSCETDIEILKASISIISLLISSNQYITITDGNN